jgi:hypothetical protein
MCPIFLCGRLTDDKNTTFFTATNKVIFVCLSNHSSISINLEE